MPTKQEERIALTSARDLHDYFAQISQSLLEPETEDSWNRLDKALARLDLVAKSGGYKYDDFVPLFRGVAKPVINSLLSERTKLSGTAADVVTSVAPRLAERFESLVPIFVPTMLQICARTNKVALARAKKALLIIAKHCKLPSLLPLLREAARDKVQTLRIVAVECTLLLLESQGSNEKIGKRVADVETIVKSAATDSNPEVRQWSKRVFELYVARWPERVEQLTTAFTPTIRRYLSLPKTGPYKPPIISSDGVERAHAPEMAARQLEAPTRTKPSQVKTATTSSSSSSNGDTKTRSVHAMTNLHQPHSSSSAPSSSSSASSSSDPATAASSRHAMRAAPSNSANNTISRSQASTSTAAAPSQVKTSFSVASGLNVASLTTAFTNTRTHSSTALSAQQRTDRERARTEQHHGQMKPSASSAGGQDQMRATVTKDGEEDARMRRKMEEEKLRRKRERREAAALAAAQAAAEFHARAQAEAEAKAQAQARAREEEEAAEREAAAEEEERERDRERRNATGRPWHPSDSVAARLAKEQTEMNKRLAQQRSMTPLVPTTTTKTAVETLSQSPTVPFSVATAKKSAHKKAVRVLVAGPPPPTTSRAPLSVKKHEQPKTNQNEYQQQRPSVDEDADDEDLENRPIPMLKFDHVDMPASSQRKPGQQGQVDVFGTTPASATIVSPPTATATIKRKPQIAGSMTKRRASSVKKGMGARQQLLGPSAKIAAVKRSAPSAVSPKQRSVLKEQVVAPPMPSSIVVANAAVSSVLKAPTKPTMTSSNMTAKAAPIDRAASVVQKRAPFKMGSAPTTTTAARPVAPSKSADSGASHSKTTVNAPVATTRKVIPSGSTLATTTSAPSATVVKKVVPSKTALRGASGPITKTVASSAPPPRSVSSGPSKAITARMRPPSGSTRTVPLQTTAAIRSVSGGASSSKGSAQSKSTTTAAAPIVRKVSASSTSSRLLQGTASSNARSKAPVTARPNPSSSMAAAPVSARAVAPTPASAPAPAPLDEPATSPAPASLSAPTADEKVEEVDETSEHATVCSRQDSADVSAKEAEKEQVHQAVEEVEVIVEEGQIHSEEPGQTLEENEGARVEVQRSSIVSKVDEVDEAERDLSMTKDDTDANQEEAVSPIAEVELPEAAEDVQDEVVLEEAPVREEVVGRDDAPSAAAMDEREEEDEEVSDESTDAIATPGDAVEQSPAEPKESTDTPTVDMASTVEDQAPSRPLSPLKVEESEHQKVEAREDLDKSMEMTLDTSSSEPLSSEPPVHSSSAGADEDEQPEASAVEEEVIAEIGGDVDVDAVTEAFAANVIDEQSSESDRIEEGDCLSPMVEAQDVSAAREASDEEEEEEGVGEEAEAQEEETATEEDLVEEQDESTSIAAPSPPQNKTVRGPFGPIDANALQKALSPTKSLKDEDVTHLDTERDQSSIMDAQEEQDEVAADLDEQQEAIDEEEAMIGEDSIQLVTSPIRPQVLEKDVKKGKYASLLNTQLDDTDVPIRITRSRAASMNRT